MSSIRPRAGGPLSIREHLGKLKGVNLVYMGDARYNRAIPTWSYARRWACTFTACAPSRYFPDKALVEQCQEIAKQTGGSITLTEDVENGTKNADVICTDVWVSMGEPDAVWMERIEDLMPYQVNRKVMQNAGNAIFMHCLPAYHDRNTQIGEKSESASVSMRWK